MSLTFFVDAMILFIQVALLGFVAWGCILTVGEARRLARQIAPAPARPVERSPRLEVPRPAP